MTGNIMTMRSRPRNQENSTCPSTSQQTNRTTSTTSGIFTIQWINDHDDSSDQIDIHNLNLRDLPPPYDADLPPPYDLVESIQNSTILVSN